MADSDANVPPGDNLNPREGSATGPSSSVPASGPATSSTSAPTSGPSTSAAPTSGPSNSATSTSGPSASASDSTSVPPSTTLPIPPIPNPSTPPQPEPEPGYNGDMRAYCKSLDNWLKRAYWQRECAVSAYFTALSNLYPFGPFPPGQSYQQGYAGIPNQSAAPNFNINLNINAGAGQPPPGSDANNNAPPNQTVRQILLRGIRRNGNRVTFDFKIAPIWKRLMAECIDFFILLVVKVFVTLSIVDNFDLIDLDSLDLDSLQESGSLMEVAYNLTSELLLLELTHRIVVCFFEAYCIFKSGATPGKSLLGLRVLYCQEVYPVVVNAGNQYNNVVNVGGGGSRILVSPGSFLTFPRALLRSVIKNFSLAFFFPICFTIFHFEHSRTLYDVVAKSIVVEIRQQ